jgi:hypothetical protein
MVPGPWSILFFFLGLHFPYGNGLLPLLPMGWYGVFTELDYHRLRVLRTSPPLDQSRLFSLFSLPWNIRCQANPNRNVIFNLFNLPDGSIARSVPFVPVLCLSPACRASLVSRLALGIPLGIGIAYGLICTSTD